jgi:ribose-phosphate pyrophosphokinase
MTDVVPVYPPGGGARHADARLRPMDDGMVVFGGSASRKLAAGICASLGVPLRNGEVRRFPEGNTEVRILENVRGRRVYIVQSVAFPANDHFMELLFWIDAFKRASAASVTAVVPYFSYAKGDKKDEPRVSIRARVCADALQAAGADRLVTMDLHAPQIQGFFRVPVDDLVALPVLCDRLQAMGLTELVVIAPDAGFAKKARRYAAYLGATLAIGDKERRGADEHAELVHIIGDVRGKTAVVVDDFTLTAGTLAAAAQGAIDNGARRVLAMVSHGLFAPGSMERIAASPIERLLVTDTVETQPVALSPKVEVVSVAPLFGEAIRRIDGRESVSVLFPR